MQRARHASVAGGSFITMRGDLDRGGALLIRSYLVAVDRPYHKWPEGDFYSSSSPSPSTLKYYHFIHLPSIICYVARERAARHYGDEGAHRVCFRNLLLNGS